MEEETSKRHIVWDKIKCLRLAFGVVANNPNTGLDVMVVAKAMYEWITEDTKND